MEGAGDLPVLDLGLGDGALEIDVPHRGRVGRVDVALLPEVEKRDWDAWTRRRSSGILAPVVDAELTRRTLGLLVFLMRSSRLG
jgi:hypothetical protein